MPEFWWNANANANANANTNANVVNNNNNNHNNSKVYLFTCRLNSTTSYYKASTKETQKQYPTNTQKRTLNTQDTKGKAGEGNIKKILRQKL